MKQGIALIALAVAATLGATAASAHDGAGRGYRADPQKVVARVDDRLNQMRTALALQPTQMGAWSAYEASVKQQRDTLMQLRQSAPPRDGDPQARADFRVTMMKARAAGAEQINNAARQLAAILSTEQRARFDEMRPLARAGGHGGPKRHG